MTCRSGFRGWCFFGVAISLLAAWAYGQDSPYRPGPGRYPRFDAKQAESGLQFGTVPDLPLPKTILFAVTADELEADCEEWTKRGIGAFFITGVAPEWSADIWGTDGAPWTIGASDANFQKVKAGAERCRALNADTFLTMAFSRNLEWFNDTAWRKIEDNFRQFARFARETGCTGVAIDIEYIWPQYHFIWEGYDYDGYTRHDLVRKIQERGTLIARAIYDEFPDAVLLTFPESAFSLGSWLQTAWIEEAARRNAPGGVHLCTEYTYRRPNIRYMLGHAWLNNRVLRMMLSPAGQAYWGENCSIVEGLWPFGIDPDDYHGAPPTVEEFRQAFAASLMIGSRYNWIYSHDARPAMLGREPAKYDIPGGMDAYMNVIAQRAVVTNPRYVDAARDLRALALRDYSRDLGLMVVPTLAGPREELEVGLMPEAVYAPSAIARSQDRLWDLGLRIQQGEVVDLSKEFGTQSRWQLVGPFPNTGKQGFSQVFPPESDAALDQEYDGIDGKVGWQEFAGHLERASINLASVFQPSEEVCAYALCFVRSERPRGVQVRVGANDSWKLWVGGRPAFENAEEGRIIVDRDIVPVSLPAGTTPILLKICNNRKDWGFVFRITDESGAPAEGIEVRTTP